MSGISADSRLILASGSPRRKDLLAEAGYHFQVCPPDIEEVEDAAMPIRELTALNARLKAEAVADRFPEQVILAADTLVLLKDEALGKPADLAEARTMLARLNGNTHHVFTAVYLLHQGSESRLPFDVSTEVTFKTLSEAEQIRYHDLIEPLDKAGAYAAQDHGDLIIESFSGSYTNVIGLPMEQLAVHLEKEFDIVPGN